MCFPRCACLTNGKVGDLLSTNEAITCVKLLSELQKHFIAVNYERMRLLSIYPHSNAQL